MSPAGGCVDLATDLPVHHRVLQALGDEFGFTDSGASDMHVLAKANLFFFDYDTPDEYKALMRDEYDVMRGARLLSRHGHAQAEAIREPGARHA